ncbi:hypothetical protein [Gemmatirosa kalamazoonensis]|uniref:hypothetical protein n=1 Tax=Gemmatirosa kalamazoonensis TaxID=861299 RepID=UPI0004AEAA9C|nr:hypothetical protein [Gemmatirosa kalamazoonensis]
MTRTLEEAKNDTGVICKVTAKDYPAVKDTSARDTLLVQIRGDDREQLVAAPRGISFGVAGVKPATVDSGHTPAGVAPMKGKTWTGAQLTVTRTADQMFICTASIKRDSEPDDSTRHPFRAGVGASFTPLSGVSKVELYYDVTIFLPDAFRTPAGHRARWGIDAGLTNGRFAGTSDTSANPAVAAVAHPGKEPGKTDSVLYIRQSVTTTHARSSDLLSLYLAPTFRLSPGLFWVAHAEATKRDLSTTVTLKTTKPDSTLYPGTTLPDTVRLRPRIQPAGTTVPPLADTTRTFRSTQYDAFFGTGPLVVIKRSQVEFRTKLIFGVGSYGPVTTGSYVGSFRVTDFAHSFKLGGEVRGEFANTNPSIIVFLAKDYDIKHLAEFIFGSSSGDSSSK